MAGKKKLGKTDDKSRKLRKRKIEDEVDLHDNQNGDVNKLGENQEITLKTQPDEKKSAKANRKGKKLQETNEKGPFTTKRKAVTSVIEEGDQVFEMEVDAEQDIFQNEEDMDLSQISEDNSADSDSSGDERENEISFEQTMQEHLEDKEASNNNATVDSGDDDYGNFLEANP